MLLDPLEEQLDLPAAFVEASDGESRKRGVVGQKDQPSILVGIVKADPPQFAGVALPGVEAVQGHKLIALQTRGLVHGLGVEPPEPEAALGPSHKEGRALVDAVKPAEVQIGAIEDVDGPRLDGDLVEDVDFVNPAGGDDGNRRDVAPQIQQRMELDGTLRRRNVAQGNSDRHRSIVVASRA